MLAPFRKFWRAFAFAGAIVVAMLVGAGHAMAWPDRTITIIVHFAPGGSNDLLGRIIATELAAALGQSVVVENRVGAAGNVGAIALSRAAPDGYTLGVLTGPILINPSLGRGSYDPMRDFAPIAFLGASPNIFLARPDAGFGTIQQLIAKAKAAPGTINFATPGVGSVSQLSMEFVKFRAGINIVHVPYTGALPAAQAVIAHTTELASVNLSGMLGMVNSGELHAIAQTGAERWPDLPDVPTLKESGFPDAILETTQFLLAPAGTPKPIVDRLAREVLAILQKPEVRLRMKNVSFGVNGEGPEQLRSRMERELKLWKTLIDQAGLKTK